MDDLRTFYRTGEPIALETVPAAASRAVARRANGDVFEADLDAGSAHFPGLGPGTYAVEAFAPDGRLLAEELTTVGAHAGERPVHGFATSFDLESVPRVLSWLRALRCTVVQIYDWMASYTAPLGPRGGWKDPSGRLVSFDALTSLAAGLRDFGAVAHAYAPVYAMDLPFAAAHPELLLYRNDGQPQSFFDFIQLADPGNLEWQRHFAGAYGSAAEAIGFNGFHIDTYGYPRVARDQHGNGVEMRPAYESFLAFFRSQRSGDLVSFNQVNGVPSAVELAPGPVFATAKSGHRTTGGAISKACWTAARAWRAAQGGEYLAGTLCEGRSRATRRSGVRQTGSFRCEQSSLLKPSPRAWEPAPCFTATRWLRFVTLTTRSTPGFLPPRRPRPSPGTASR